MTRSAALAAPGLRHPQLRAGHGPGRESGELLGHWTVASTMRYVRPSETFIEDAYRHAVSAALGELTEGE